MTVPSEDNLGKLVEDLAERQKSGMLCEPCLSARIFGGRHHCTGRSSNLPGQPCPCPGEEDG